MIGNVREHMTQMGFRVHARPGDVDIEALFFNEFISLNDNGDSLSTLIKQVDGPNYSLDLGRDLVLPWAWHKDRIVDSLALIG
jgi:hypothetical protein